MGLKTFFVLIVTQTRRRVKVTTRPYVFPLSYFLMFIITTKIVFLSIQYFEREKKRSQNENLRRNKSIFWVHLPHKKVLHHLITFPHCSMSVMSSEQQHLGFLEDAEEREGEEREGENQKEKNRDEREEEKWKSESDCFLM